jgi:hypothetical protein
MKEAILEGTFLALSPLHIGTGERKGNFHPTEIYVTAKALRGMLGTFLYHYDKELFEESRIGKEDSTLRFFPSYPSGSLPVPSNLRWCKRCGKLLEKEGELCPDDGNEGKRRSGLFFTNSLKEKKFKEVEIGRTIQAKVPIVRQTGASPDKEYKLKPYNIQVFGKGTEFDFMLKCPEEMAEKIKGLPITIAGIAMHGNGKMKINK